MDNLVYIRQNRCWTNSKILAEAFDKKHMHVLRDIRRIIRDMQDADFIGSNFGFNYINTLQGKEIESCDMTRDAFYFVAFGFSGKKALAFKRKFLDEFNRRGDELTMRGKTIHEPKAEINQTSQKQQGEDNICKKTPV